MPQVQDCVGPSTYSTCSRFLRALLEESSHACLNILNIKICGRKKHSPLSLGLCQLPLWRRFSIANFSSTGFELIFPDWRTMLMSEKAEKAVYLRDGQFGCVIWGNLSSIKQEGCCWQTRSPPLSSCLIEDFVEIATPPHRLYQAISPQAAIINAMKHLSFCRCDPSHAQQTAIVNSPPPPLLQ